MFFSQFFDSFMNQKDEEVIKKIDWSWKNIFPEIILKMMMMMA